MKSNEHIRTSKCLSASYDVYYSPTMTLKDKTQWGKN